MRRTANVACGWMAIVALAASTTACGYALTGRGSFLPDYIETVGIPLFENRTAAFDVEQLLTEQVRTAFIARGSYSVVTGEADVDALLSGIITNINIVPASFNADQQASRYVFTLTASIEFIDVTTDEVLWENPALIFSDEYEVVSGAGEVANVETFFGQRSNAVERVAQDFGQTVVSSILEAF